MKIGSFDATRDLYNVPEVGLFETERYVLNNHFGPFMKQNRHWCEQVSYDLTVPQWFLICLNGVVEHEKPFRI